MKRAIVFAIRVTAAVLAATGVLGASAKDKYTLKVPGGLAFSAVEQRK